MARGRLSVVLYHDVLCAWSFLADARLAVLREEYAGSLDFSHQPLPTRPEPAAPTRRALRLWARHYRRAAKEPEGAGIVPDLWLSGDPPCSSLPPLLALEAARLQGRPAHDRLLGALREAAFRRGLNVARRDVLIELADREGLAVDRFVTVLDSPATERAVLVGQAEAAARGVRGVPALVLGGEWVVTGARSLAEYREAFARYLSERQSALPERLLH